MTWVRTGIADFTIGDRIRFTCEMYGERVEGTVYDHDGQIHVERDDGEAGGGYDDTWIVNTENNGQLYRWVDDAPAIVPHWGEAVRIDTIPVGTRVRNAQDVHQRGAFEGVLVQLGTGTQWRGNFAWIERDDGRHGGFGDDDQRPWSVYLYDLFEPWVGDAAAPAAETWEPITFQQMAVGDRVRFREYGTGPHVAGEVIEFTGIRGTVRRDDGVTGGGLDDQWFVNFENCRAIERLGVPLTEEELANRPMRAVFCECCGYATGEFTNTEAAERYCIQCRNLPALWEYGGTPRPGLINTGDEPRRQRGIERTHAIGAIPGARPAAVRAAIPTFDDEPPEAPEPEQYGIPCTECGGHDFRVRGIQIEPGTTVQTYYQNTGDNDPGDTVYFEIAYEDVDFDIVPNTGHVVCDDCGARQHDMNWELG